MSNLIKVDNVHYSINENNLIRGISFELKKNEICHIQGVNGSGKTLLIKTVLNDLFDINKYTKKELLTENIIYERSDFHYYFDLKLVNNDLKFIDFIKEIVKSYNHYTNKYNYIILDNFEHLSNLNQDRLRVIFEKSLKKLFERLIFKSSYIFLLKV